MVTSLLLVQLLSAPAPLWAGEPVARVGEERVPDPGRWLEKHERDEVEAWWAERRTEARAWIDAGEVDRELLTSWLHLWRSESTPVPRLMDHRAGVSLWSVTTRELYEPPVEDGESEDPGADDGTAGGKREFTLTERRWLTRLFVQQPGEAWPGTELVPSEEERIRLLCMGRLDPTGRQVIHGRRPAWEDLSEEERGEPQPCPLRLRDLETGEETELGELTWANLSWRPEQERILLSHRVSKRRAALAWLDPETGAIEEIRRDRFLLQPWLHEDGSFVGFSTWSVKRGRKPARILLGDIDEPDDLSWVRTFWRWPWYGSASMVGYTGEEVLLLTDWYGEGRNVIRVDPEQPTWYHWRVPVEERPGMDLEHGRLHGEDLYLVWARGGLQQLEVRPWAGGLGEILDLGMDATSVRTWRSTQEHAIIEARSPVKVRWLVRARTGELALIHEHDVAEDATFEVLEIPADDGTPVPVSLLSPKAPAPPEGRPVLLHVYGGFGSSQGLHGMSSVRRAWLDAGGVYGVIHARGGRELGEGWHEAALLEKLPRTFDDVVSVARGLVDLGIAEEGRVAITGASNGGLTVAAAVARDPGAFGAVIGSAGVYDLLRARRFGRWWPDEYGRLKEPEQRAVLRAESPVHRVPEGPLPPVLVITGKVDPIVSPAHSYKLVQAWSELEGGPVLLEVDLWGSHGGDAEDREDWVVEDSDQLSALKLAFLARALGVRLLPELQQPEQPEQPEQPDPAEEPGEVPPSGTGDAAEGHGG